MSVPARAYLSIGEVLSRLRTEFSDITISKIRFLESEGLIEPQRTPSGYRKFTTNDLERLRFVLLAQRDQYLPLKVIKENLDAMDRGLTPAKVVGGVASPRLASNDGVLTADQFASDNDLRLTRAELLSKAVAEISAFGIGARHLRAFKTAADREIGLVEQVTTPLLRQKGTEAKARAEEVERELASLSIRLHASLVRAGLHRAK